MKFSFSTKNVRRSTFIDLCKTAKEYGFSAFEIFDALEENHLHLAAAVRHPCAHSSYGVEFDIIALGDGFACGCAAVKVNA